MTMLGRKENGVVALLTAIIIGLFLFSVGALLAVQGNTSIFSGQFTTQSDKAEALAQAGVSDALIRLARNRSYSGSYIITETDGVANVTVSATGTITSVGVVANGKEQSQRTIVAAVTSDSDGKLTSIIQSDQ